MRLKIFIRWDIWKRITDEGFREADHITKMVDLEWSSSTLLNLAIRRLLANKRFIQDYQMKKDDVLANFDAQKDCFLQFFQRKLNRELENHPR